MFNQARVLVVLIVLAGTFCITLARVATAEHAQPTKPEETKYTEIVYSADKSSYRWDAKDKVLVLTGNVRFSHGDTVMVADKVEYREAADTATASGNLKISDGRNSVTGDSCDINFDEKKVSVTGNVRMVIKPKPKPQEPNSPKTLKEELKDEAILTCASIEYYYKEKKAVIPTSVTIVQKTRTITADSAVYLGQEEVIQLVGNVRGQDEKDKHTFSSPKVTISLKKDDEWIEAEKATGSFFVKEKKEE